MSDAKHIETIRQIADYIELRPHAVEALQAAIAALEKQAAGPTGKGPLPDGAIAWLDMGKGEASLVWNKKTDSNRASKKRAMEMFDRVPEGYHPLYLGPQQATPARGEAQGAVAWRFKYSEPSPWEFSPYEPCTPEGWKPYAAKEALYTHPQQEAEDARRYRESLESVIQYGSDTLSGQFVDREDRAKWYRDGVKEMVRRARAAMKGEG